MPAALLSWITKSSIQKVGKDSFFGIDKIDSELAQISR